jgi:hypothetical protein
MAAHGIEDRAAFLNFAVAFDHDSNQYLKKSELEDAAKAWDEAAESEQIPVDDSSDEESNGEESNDEEPSGEELAEEAPADDDEVVADESTDETATDDSQVSDDESKACPVCQQSNNSDATLCADCGFHFE